MEKEMIDGLPAVPGRDQQGRPLLLMWLGFLATTFWAGELLRALPLAQGGGGAAVGLLRAPAEVEADDEMLLVDTAAVARLVGAYAIFLLSLVATLMLVVVGLPRREPIPSAALIMLLSAVIWHHLQRGIEEKWWGRRGRISVEERPSG
ncbi:uncharacterized protein LOC122040144 [Zingiber officinale]|uniref:uncharacterized protein LOC122040144 n=1 Tax=Zingiber officinale TaxID=94328 RepID=UPI001C4B5FD4|nr:uncharacterized protein LOC122040144 [Zingiber officinale]XP_042455424.1 uncharacterized protein LOC122040144 [Zingiber officinale]